MEAKYVKTEKLTDDGQVIYHKITGKGRPALCVLVGADYVAWKRPLKPVVKKSAESVA